MMGVAPSAYKVSAGQARPGSMARKQLEVNIVVFADVTI